MLPIPLLFFLVVTFFEVVSVFLLDADSFATVFFWFLLSVTGLAFLLDFLVTLPPFLVSLLSALTKTSNYLSEPTKKSAIVPGPECAPITGLISVKRVTDTP